MAGLVLALLAATVPTATGLPVGSSPSSSSLDGARAQARRGQAPAATAGCSLSGENERLIQDALDAWARISGDYLELDPHPLPWMVLFDASCVWHLAPDESSAPDARPVDVSFRFAGEPVETRVEPHDGAVRLPNGSEIPAQGLAFASVHDEGRASFFAMALLDVWRQMPGVEESGMDLHEFFLGVLSHEIVHTRQLVHVNARIAELGEGREMPESIDDDIVEERFGEVPGYAAAYEAESDLFYEAVAERDPDRRRELVAEALRLVRRRHERWFTGDDEIYRELDGLFLNMEGVAVWAAYRLSRENPDSGPDGGSPAFERARNTWTQDEGLALFLLLDEMVPDWRPRVLGPELASPFALLEEAIRDPA